MWAIHKGVWPGRVLKQPNQKTGVIVHPGLQYKNIHHAATYVVSHCVAVRKCVHECISSYPSCHSTVMGSLVSQISAPPTCCWIRSTCGPTCSGCECCTCNVLHCRPCGHNSFQASSWPVSVLPWSGDSHHLSLGREQHSLDGGIALWI